MLTKTMLRVLGAAAFIAGVSVGCSEVEIYNTGAPSDLESRIDSIANANVKPSTGDTTYVTLATTFIGAEDGSSAWWGEHSDYFEVPVGKKLVMEFYNYGTQANNWNNWNLAVVNSAANSTSENSNYAEYFVIRSDVYGWGGSLGTYDGAMLKSNYGDTDEDGNFILDLDGDGDYWNDFRSEMYGAFVTLEIDHSSTGYVYVTATEETKSDLTLVETYEQECTASESVYAFIVTDASWFKMVQAYLVPSEVTVLEDYDPVSITASGYPTSIEVGNEDVVGNAVFNVTFADGSSAVADTADVTISVDEAYLTTPGTYTVVYSYSKTKLGEYGNSVNGYYEIEVTNPVVSISAEATAYLIGGAKYLTLSPANIKATAVYADNSEAALKTSQFTVAFTDDKVVYEGVAGTYEDAFTVTYTTASGEELTATGDLVIAASSQDAQTEMVGATDFTNGWWSTFSRDWNVDPYTSQTVSMKVGSDNLGNWHSPCTIARKADYTEYAVVRMDNFGWGGTGYDSAVLESNWNWDTFMTSIDGSEVAVTVANAGDGTLSIRYYVIYSSGETHYQYYDNIAVDADDVTFAFVTEESYLVFD